MEQGKLDIPLTSEEKQKEDDIDERTLRKQKKRERKEKNRELGIDTRKLSRRFKPLGYDQKDQPADIVTKFEVEQEEYRKGWERGEQ